MTEREAYGLPADDRPPRPMFDLLRLIGLALLSWAIVIGIGIALGHIAYLLLGSFP